jgi:hypothetical protein
VFLYGPVCFSLYMCVFLRAGVFFFCFAQLAYFSLGQPMFIFMT